MQKKTWIKLGWKAPLMHKKSSERNGAKKALHQTWFKSFEK